MHVGDVSSNTGAGEPEDLGDAEVFGNLKELRITGPLTRPLLIRSRMSCIPRPRMLSSLWSHKSYISHFMITSPSRKCV
jgi:hypothetical protein